MIANAQLFGGPGRRAEGAQVAEAGGKEAVYKNMAELAEEMHPGYQAAIIDKVDQTHPSWAMHLFTGPKLPRRSPSVDGLWYVGDGSEPYCGIGMEASASAGILGARGILAGEVVYP